MLAAKIRSENANRYAVMMIPICFPLRPVVCPPTRYPNVPRRSDRKPGAHLVLEVASDQAFLNTLGQSDRDGLLEVGEVVLVDLLGEAESSIDDVTAGVDEEVLGDGAGTGVLGVETGDGDRRVAVEVLLPVDAALGEGGTLEERQAGALLGDEAVLSDEAGGDVGVGDDGEELGGIWVDVRGVKTAGLEKDAGGGDAQTGQEREVLAVGKVDLAAERLGAGGGDWVGLGVEVELQGEVAGGDLSSDLCEAVDAGVFGQELGDGTSRGLWVGGGIRVAEEAG